VDVTFQLIIFFILVAQFTSAERIDLSLPRIIEPAAAPDSPQKRVVINVVPDDRAPGGAVYSLGVRRLDSTDEGLRRLVMVLERRRALEPEVCAIVRAARTERYDRAPPALEACRIAGITDVRLVAEETGG